MTPFSRGCNIWRDREKHPSAAIAISAVIVSPELVDIEIAGDDDDEEEEQEEAEWGKEEGVEEVEEETSMFSNDTS